MLRTFKVLTFDVVGTLIDFERGMLNYLREVSRADERKLNDDAILDCYRRHRGNAPTKRFPDDLVRVYSAMAPDLGLPAGAAAAEGFRHSITSWPAFTDSVEALRRLRARYRLVAMTNAQRWALDHMEKTLGEPFHDTVTVDEARCEKPDPVFFGFTRGRLSVEGYVLEDILHVAQSQYHDIGVARELGYTVCWIERRKGLKGSGGTLEAKHTKPDYHFATLAELADAIDAEG
ncbi:putative hydrolase of the HAD superfamily [Rhizobiales bacterium GAS188]|nr:putative hydrolase of the HAD superfamily [Rhizobiales bacterium GAS188]